MPSEQENAPNTAQTLPRLLSYLDIPCERCRCLTRQEIDMMLQTLSMEAQSGFEAALDLGKPGMPGIPTYFTRALTDTLAYRIIVSRLKQNVPDIKVSPYLVAYLTALCASPGEAVMTAFTLKRIWDQQKTLVGVGDWAGFFPNGFPSTEAKEFIWDSQKGSAHGIKQDNLLDDPEYWKV